MQKITPFLWFDGKAEEAANFYVSIFSDAGGSASGGKNSKVGAVTRYDDASAKATGMPKGTAMTVSFQLEGQEFIALNGGPNFKFTEAISFVIDCRTQEEVDYYWEKLCEGGQESMCGWLKDKFGLSWQVVPTILTELFKDKDPAKSQRVMQAMLQMKKIDIESLKKASEGK
jgi:predicted 3-demethylubiquinone-9 3-methyltransferase (glyoxalase superfamily)